MTVKHREAGLSEVMGFVLIIGLIVVVASLYLTYGVPAQGRENEILHMNEVKDQFVTYKVSLDSLYTNDKVGTTMSNSFNLGTPGGYTQGSLSFMPLMSPIGSGGTLAINPVGTNQRVSENETLTLTSRSLILNETSNFAVDYSPGSPATVNYTPSNVFVKITNIPASYQNKDGFYGWTVNSTSWIAMVNLSPQVSFYQNYALVNAVTCPTSVNGTVLSIGSNNCLVPINIYNYTRSDLTITIRRGDVYTMQNYPVYQKINFGQPQPYTIDLMDSAYGLNSAIRSPQTVAVYPYDGTAGISASASGNVTYNFVENPSNTIGPIPLGSLEYQAQNNYWIPQKYYYQMGGVFLRQSDGNTTYKLPPEITFAYDNPQDPKILTVNVNALSIDPRIPSNHGIVAGSSPVQVKTTLKNITAMPFISGNANTQEITISIDTTDDKARAMWRNYFDYTAKVAHIPQADYSANILGNTSYITLYGYDHRTDSTADYDINVIASNATYETFVHGVGGIVQ